MIIDMGIIMFFIYLDHIMILKLQKLKTDW